MFKLQLYTIGWIWIGYRPRSIKKYNSCRFFDSVRQDIK